MKYLKSFNESEFLYNRNPEQTIIDEIKKDR